MSEIYDIPRLLGRTSSVLCFLWYNMRQVKVKLIDSLPQLGGQPAILYPKSQYPRVIYQFNR